MDDEKLPTSELPRPDSGNESDQSAPIQSMTARFISYIRTDINLGYADIPIITCCLCSGLCDSSAYNAWTCFVSMQTGNTIFLALGASGQPATHPYGWLKSFISVLFFLTGCFFFASSRHIGAKKRGTLSLSFLIQSLCILVAAALVQGRVVPEPKGILTEQGSETHFIEIIALSLLAFQSGGQIVTSRLLGFNEIPTTVLTSVYCDLASDPKLWAPLSKNVKRNRRAASVVMILTGGLVGGWLSRSSVGMSTVLWLAGSIKMVVAISWLLWKEGQ